MLVRVLLSTPYPVNSATGVGSFVRSLADELRRQGVNIYLAEPPLDAEPRGIANVLLAIRSLREVLSHRRTIDVIHCQQLHLQSLVVGLAGRLTGAGVVLTVHGRSPTPPALRGLVFRLVEAFCARVPHRLVFVARTLQAEFGPIGSVISNGVATDRI